MNKQQLPQEVLRLASQHQLGMFEKEYPGKPDDEFAYLVSGLLFTLLGLYCLISNDASAGGVLVILGLILSLPYFISFVHFSLRRRRRSYLYEHGLVLAKCQQKQIVAAETIHWRDIAIIWHQIISQGTGVTPTITHLYSLQRRNGSIFGESLGEEKITDAELGNRMERMALRYLFPEAVLTHQRGLPIPFGPLTIEPTGIKYEGQILPWHLFDSLEIDEKLVIRQREKGVWAKMSLAEIPNPALLRELTYHLADA